MANADWRAHVEQQPTNQAFQDLVAAHEQAHDGRLDIDGAGSTGLAAWFLGPKAENHDLFRELIQATIEAEIASRESVYHKDPAWVTNADRRSAPYATTVAQLRSDLAALNAALGDSVPFYSYRYQAHMLWDITLPSIIGYFAGMLRNQNNVAAEASPVTTYLEMQVGDDLCRMLGYRAPSNAQPDTDETKTLPRGWGHITADGSIANIESMWAARNLKYYPLAVKDALVAEPLLEKARDIEVPIASGPMHLLRELDDWHLLNLSVDATLAITDDIRAALNPCGDSDQEAAAQATQAVDLINNYSVQRLGVGAFARRLHAQGIGEPLILTPATNHYSWPKGAALLGLGSAHLEPVHVDLDGRMLLDHLRSRLQECAAPATRRPVMAVVAVIGTTEESSVDPLAGILELRAEVRARYGLDFYVHADAAWGGYFASLLRHNHALRSAEEQHGADVTQKTPAMIRVPVTAAMNEYVEAQYRVLHHADSITVDPHKAGYIPYPAGALCYRNSAARHMVAFTAPIVYHGGSDPTVGVYGIEGSKPGAAASSVYLSHRLIRPDESGYGQILGRCLFNSKRFYMALLTMPRDDDPFTVTPFQRKPTERFGPKDGEARDRLRRVSMSLHDGEVQPPATDGVPPGDHLATREMAIFRKLVEMSNEELWTWIHQADDHKTFFRNLGSDQVIVGYSFNPKCDGRPNKDPAVANRFNKAIYDALSMRSFVPVVPHSAVAADAHAKRPPMIVTGSEFDPAAYGDEFVASYMERIGLEGDPVGIQFLSTTTMNPFVTDTEKGDFLPKLMRKLRKAVKAVHEDGSWRTEGNETAES